MFTQKFNKYSCEGDTITCEVNGFLCDARIYRDENTERPDQRQDGFWPSKDEANAGYVEPGRYGTEYAKAVKVMKMWENDEWFYCGIAVTVEKEGVTLTGKYDHALWGVECNYPDTDNAYLSEVANELLKEAVDHAKEKISRLCKV